jgi:two-component system phosphate regulon sensor histidine kinase PhoR
VSPEARSAWSRTLGRTGAWLAAWLAAGFLSGHPWALLAVAACVAVAWQAWRLRAFLAVMDSRQRPRPRSDRGAWGEVERLLQRDHDDARARQRRLLDMLRAYRALGDALPDAVIVAERDSQRIIWFNAAATRLLDLRHPADTGSPLGERLRPLPIAHWLAAGRNAEPINEVASPVDPGVRLSLRLVPYSEDVWVVIVRDVTRLTRLEQVRRDFVANVSHELRTPLTVVHGYLEMLVDGAADAGGRDPGEPPGWAPMLAEMKRQSGRMTQLVEDLLTLSRLEAQEAVKDEVVAMAPMLESLRREAEALSQGRHAVTVEDTAQVDVLGSPRELHSAFSNLVSNAVRYTPEGGRIAIAFARDQAGAALSVRDTGFGIPDDHLPRLTERFYRVSASRSRESGGTGLGLAIVKHVLGLHQARLDIASEVGRGSTFTCRFGGDRVRPRKPGTVPA